MKKMLKSLLIVAFLAVVLVALTGCGNKIVATKTTEETNFYGDTIKYDEKVEIKFKGDTVKSVKMTYKFESEDEATEMKAMFDLAKAFMGEEVEFEVKQSGKKLSIELDAEAYAEMEGGDLEVSKDELKEELEEDGYKVK